MDHTEMLCHIEKGETENTIDLLSLMKCNLYDIHFGRIGGDLAYPMIAKLGQDTLTEKGKADWADVLSAKVESIQYGDQCILCRLTDYNALRLKAFAEMLYGQCSFEDYEAWVKRDGVVYGTVAEKRSVFENQYSAGLVATYEELMEAPPARRVTVYCEHYTFKPDAAEAEIRRIYLQALDAMEMTAEEFKAQGDCFRCRAAIIGRMRDCLLANELQNGEEVLFVATVPYGSSDDFSLRGGILRGVDAGVFFVLLLSLYFVKQAALTAFFAVSLPGFKEFSRSQIPQRSANGRLRQLQLIFCTL